MFCQLEGTKEMCVRLYLGTKALAVVRPMKALLDHVTPVEKVTFKPKEGDAIQLFLKREDLFVVPKTKQCGSKARACWFLLKKAKKKGKKGVKTVILGRSSPHSARVAELAKLVDLPCRIYAPQGDPWPQLTLAAQAGAKVVVSRCGYPNVINKAAREDPKSRDWHTLPFGLECPEYLDLNKNQVCINLRNRLRIFPLVNLSD
jgi:threonine dehydratase